MAVIIPTQDPDAASLIDAVRTGDVAALRGVLADEPGLATAVFGDKDEARSALHVATDWPGHFPAVAAVIATLVAAGADVDAPMIGPHTERPLHWAASSGDLEALDALILAGADLDAPGGVLTGGGPLDDAVIFEMNDAARRLVDAGATVHLFHAAALGLTDRVPDLLGAERSQDELDAALWHAARNGETAAAELLLAAGADASFEGFAGDDTVAIAAARGHVELSSRLANAAS